MMKMVFQYSDNIERELGLRNVQLVPFSRELLGEFHGSDNQRQCINRNRHIQQERFKKIVSKSIILYDFKQKR